MIGLCVNAAKANYIFANQGTTRDIKSLKEDIKLIMADFNYPGSLTTSTEQDINNRLGKAWVALNKNE